MGKTGLQKALWEPHWLVGGGEAREALLWLKNGETEIKAGGSRPEKFRYLAGAGVPGESS